MKKIKSFRTICTAFISCLLLNISAFPACAYQVRVNENGNFIRMGGINEFDGIKAASYDETVLLESELRNSGYILVNTDFKDITDEEYDMFTAYSFWFSSYINPDNEYYNTMYKVYVYELSYNDMITQHKEYGSIEDYTSMEINSGTVVISYGYWDSLEKAGTADYEYNENIPEGRESGYLQILSPVDTEIRLHFPITDRYHDFFISANEPFLVRLKTGAYNIINVNGYVFRDKENTIKNNNIIHIEEKYTAENPYTVELHKLIETYGILPVGTDKETDLPETPNQDIPEEKVKVEEETEKNNPDKNNYLFIFAVTIIIVMICVWIYKRKKEKRNDC